jgi:hypothetical protein
MSVGLAERVRAVNELLSIVFRCPTRASELLEGLGASRDEIQFLRDANATQVCESIVQVVRECFETFRNGPRDFVALSRRLGLDAPISTLQAIGSELGICRERVRQLECRARAKGGSPRVRRAVEVALSTALEDLRHHKGIREGASNPRFQADGAPE